MPKSNHKFAISFENSIEIKKVLTSQELKDLKNCIGKLASAGIKLKVDYTELSS